MQKQQGISTLVGIIIIVAVAVVIFGGVFAYQYISAKAQPVVQTQQTPNSTTTLTPINQSIRNSDLSKFMIESHLVVLKLDQEINTPQYADLDNDGSEEAAFSIFGGGTGGSFGPFVVKLKNNELVQLKIEKDPSISEEVGSNWGHEGLLIFNNKLIKYFPLYKSGDSNASPTGGSRYILYKWDRLASQFLVDRTLDLGSEWDDKKWQEINQEAIRNFGI